jgi:alpha-1,3-rhamnosyl/mannosyltransferase
MRVGVDGTSWSTTRGFGRFARNAVGRLVERDTGTTYVLVVDEEHPGAPLPPGAEVLRVPLGRRPSLAAAAGSRRSVTDLLRLTRAVRRSRVDAFVFPSLYTWFPVVGAPTIVGVHDTMVEDVPELTVPARRDRVASRLKHAAGIRTATTLFTVSETARRAITRSLGIPADRLRIVPEAPDPVFTPRDADAVAAARAGAGVEPGRPFFLCFGGISPHKNVETLVDAYAAFRAQRGGTTPLLVLVGELESSAYASSAASVRARIAQHGLGEVVRTPGFVPDEVLAGLCSAALAVVLPSLAEGFGLPAVEAAACGAALALSDLEAHRETLGDAAVFFAPKDTAALAGVLARLDADETLRADLGRRAQERVAGLTWDAAADELAALVAETAGRR